MSLLQKLILAAAEKQLIHLGANIVESIDLLAFFMDFSIEDREELQTCSIDEFAKDYINNYSDQ